jgi:hypothetical protein
MNRKKITKRWQAIGAGLALVLVTATAGYGSVPSVDIGDADRAVEIARQARDRVEISSTFQGICRAHSRTAETTRYPNEPGECRTADQGLPNG